MERAAGGAASAAGTARPTDETCRRHSLTDNGRCLHALAQAVSDLKLQITDVKRIASILSDAETALELLDVQTPADEGSTDLLHEANAFLHDLEAALDAWELQRLLDMPYASSGAVLTITAGAGGTDAQVLRGCGTALYTAACSHLLAWKQDWAEMLLRMYERWACAQGFTCKVCHGTTEAVQHTTPELT